MSKIVQWHLTSFQILLYDIPEQWTAFFQVFKTLEKCISQDRFMKYFNADKQKMHGYWEWVLKYLQKERVPLSSWRRLRFILEDHYYVSSIYETFVVRTSLYGCETDRNWNAKPSIYALLDNNTAFVWVKMLSTYNLLKQCGWRFLGRVVRTNEIRIKAFLHCIWFVRGCQKLLYTQYPFEKPEVELTYWDILLARGENPCIAWCLCQLWHIITWSTLIRRQCTRV